MSSFNRWPLIGGGYGAYKILTQNFVLLAYGNFKTFRVTSSKTDSVWCMCKFSAFNF